MTEEIDTGAPERIWAVFEQHQSKRGHPVVFASADETKGQEYVRADSYKAERQRAEKAEVAIRLSDAEYWRQRAKKAEAALRICVDALDAAHSDVRQSDAVQAALHQDEGDEE